MLLKEHFKHILLRLAKGSYSVLKMEFLSINENDRLFRSKVKKNVYGAKVVNFGANKCFYLECGFRKTSFKSAHKFFLF